MTDPRDGDGRDALAPQPGAASSEVLASGVPASGVPAPGRAAGPSGKPVGHLLRQRITDLSLRARLLVVLLLAVLVALVATGYLSQRLLRGYLVDQLDDQLTNGAGRAVGFALNPPRRGDAGRGLPGGFVVQLWDGETGDAPTLFPALTDGPAFPPMAAEQYPVLVTGLDPRTVRSVHGTANWRWVSGAFQNPLDNTFVYAQVALPMSGIDDVVAKLQLVTLVLGALLIALVGGLGRVAIRRSFRPLVEVEETAAAIAAGDLSRRIPERPASTEVGRLTRSLNGMLTQIESAFRAREASEARTRRFAADASHELRTPLVSIRGFAELYRQGAVPPDEVPRTMRRIEDEAKRMGSLVEDLLLLARLDEQRAGRHDPVDLAVLAGDAVHDARGLDASRTVTLAGLHGSGPQTAVVTGDEDRLRQVVANLVANAVRHTPEGTPIQVAVGRADGTAVLEVRDHGQGLTPEQAQRVFERFYRVDASRRRGNGGGSGLGLSIVAAVVAAHAGQVEVLPTPGGGATFRVTLPARPDGGASAPDGAPEVTGPAQRPLSRQQEQPSEVVPQTPAGPR